MPTRFGMMASQMKAFFDGTGGLLMQRVLNLKVPRKLLADSLECFDFLD